MEVLKNYIDGEFVECSKHLDSYNPATGEVHLQVPDSGKEEVQAAVEAAKRAFKKSVPSCFVGGAGVILLCLCADGPRLVLRTVLVL